MKPNLNYVLILPEEVIDSKIIFADKLYSLISEVEGGNDHIFIENFVQNGDVIEVDFGS